MKTIEQFVRDGIISTVDLEDALQTAMQLEFSTIPPYLCAQWSIDTDPSDVGGMIQKIVVQEMFHFALVGNMLTAIGGTPEIANAAFVPTYPTDVLPGGISQEIPVDLKALSPDQLQVFMQIEKPEFPPVAVRKLSAPATIGEFYNAISNAFDKLKPTIDTNARFVKMREAIQITSIADAQAAIARIKQEGEGTRGSPDQPSIDGTQFAHYYLFKEISTKHKLKQNGTCSFTGDDITFPTVNNFTQSSASPSPSIPFNQALSQLLIDLQTCWTNGSPPNIGTMIQLETLGRGLIEHAIRPEFRWAAPTMQM